MLIEGVSSTIVFLLDFHAKSPRRVLGERAHTKYDPDLGWINIPNFYAKDMYAPGIYLRINSKAFRSNHDISDEIPAGKVRVICSGDSFTLGFGVDNDHTWCELLESIDTRLETVNMGQSGYGVDQAYLWYKRDAAQLNHNVVIVAVIAEDFRRMQSPGFFGHGKPVLRVRNGQLVTDNVPVPKSSDLARWIALRRNLLLELRTVELFGRLKTRTAEAAESGEDAAYNAALRERPVVSKLLDSLKEITEARHSTLVVVYLPTGGDYRPDLVSDSWQEFMAEETSKRNIVYYNLVPDFRKLSPQDSKKLFIPKGTQFYAAATGHYSIAGNEYVARELHEKLSHLPGINAAARTGN